MGQDKLLSLKYNELQKLAKSVGIKANMKIDKLRIALATYYQEHQSDAADENQIESSAENQANGMKQDVDQPQNKAKKGQGKKKKDRVTKSKTAGMTEIHKNITPTIAKLVRPGNLKAKRPSLYSPFAKKCMAVKSVTPTLGANGTPKGTPKVATPKRTPKPATPKIVSAKTVTPKVATPKLIDHMKGKQDMPGSRTPTSNTGPTKRAGTPTSLKRKNDKTGTPQEAKKRRSTFEVVPLPEEPVAEPRSTRRSTFESNKPAMEERKSGSPGVKDMLGALTGNMESAEMNDKLMTVLDEKVQNRVKAADPAKKTGIPRFAAFLAAKRAKEQKVLTPGSKNWTKIHQKQFDKMDSIDVYLSKKRKRQEDFTNSAKKTKLLLEETKEAITRLKSHKTPMQLKEKSSKKETKSALFVTPGNALKTKTPVPLPKTKTPVVLKSKTPVTFQPTVFSTKDMNLNFASNTRKSPRTSTSSTAVFQPSVFSTSGMNLNFGKAKTPGAVPGNKDGCKSFVTPFRFNASMNCTMVDSKSTTKKFDLKASLARPITWKTYKGKLQPLVTSAAHSKAGGNPNVSLKSPKFGGRENRRASAVKRRANQKLDKQMSRRGIAA